MPDSTAQLVRLHLLADIPGTIGAPTLDLTLGYDAINHTLKGEVTVKQPNKPIGKIYVHGRREEAQIRSGGYSAFTLVGPLELGGSFAAAFVTRGEGWDGKGSFSIGEEILTGAQLRPAN
jgi:hypothetical protein